MRAHPGLLLSDRRCNSNFELNLSFVQFKIGARARTARRNAKHFEVSSKTTFLEETLN